jgi:hypothetical protein
LWNIENFLPLQNQGSGFSIGVDFFRAIDTYALNTRAVKYAILFLIIPFLTLFLFEVFAKKRIHPVPYLLSGIASRFCGCGARDVSYAEVGLVWRRGVNQIHSLPVRETGRLLWQAAPIY